jgi:N-acetyl-gamma-glutamylphosphate reductase
LKIRVIVFGATGMVGEGVLFKALSHEDVESVLVIGRRSCMVAHPKLKEIIHHDFFNYSSIEEPFKFYAEYADNGIKDEMLRCAYLVYATGC